MTYKKSEAAKRRREEMERKMEASAIEAERRRFEEAVQALSPEDEVMKGLAALGASLTATRAGIKPPPAGYKFAVTPKVAARLGPHDVESALAVGALPAYVVRQVAAVINNGDAEEYAKLCAQLWNYRDPKNPLYRH